MRLSQQQVEHIIKTNHPNIDKVSTYRGSQKPLSVHCSICGAITTATAKSFLYNGKGCKNCDSYNGHKLTFRKIKARVHKLNPNIKILNKVTNERQKVAVICTNKHCKLHGQPWITTVKRLLKGEGCPYCNVMKGHKKHIKSFSHYKTMVKQRLHGAVYIYLDEKFHGSRTKIKAINVKTGKIKHTTINNLLKHTSKYK